MLKKKQTKKHSSCLEELSQGKQEGPRKKKKTATEPDVDLTPMHIPCISGDISKPQIYKRSTM